MRRKRHQISVRALSILLWLYAVEVFDPKEPADQSNEKGLKNKKQKGLIE